MIKRCQYCGEQQTALKNHIRLSSGDGHGPSGTYPDDFEDGTSTDLVASQDDVGASGGPPTTSDSDTVELTPEEIDEMVETAAGEARTERYETEQIDTQHEQEVIEVESTVEDASTTVYARAECPECGESLDTDIADTTFFAIAGEVVTLEQGDGLCEVCDIVVGNDGEVIYGSESKKANPTPACTECGNETINTDHAVYIISRYFQNTSLLRVFTRRRLKRIAENVQRQNPNYVCPNCWMAFG